MWIYVETIAATQQDTLAETKAGFWNRLIALITAHPVAAACIVTAIIVLLIILHKTGWKFPFLEKYIQPPDSSNHPRKTRKMRRADIEAFDKLIEDAYQCIDAADYLDAMDRAHRAEQMMKGHGDDDPKRKAKVATVRGTICHLCGEYTDALKYFDSALRFTQISFGEIHPDTATSYNNIGAAYYDNGEYQKALENFEKALHIRQKNLAHFTPILPRPIITLALYIVI